MSARGRRARPQTNEGALTVPARTKANNAMNIDSGLAARCSARSGDGLRHARPTAENRARGAPSKLSSVLSQRAEPAFAEASETAFGVSHEPRTRFLGH